MSEQFSLTSPDTPNREIEDDPIPKAFQYFVEVTGKSERYLLTQSRYKKARLRWEEEAKNLRLVGVSRSDLRKEVGMTFKHVIDELAESDFHRENGYLDWEQLFDSSERFEKWKSRWESGWSEKQKAKGKRR